MRKILGVIIIILGIIILVGGSIFLLIYSICDMIVNFNNLTASQLIWDVIFIFCRELITLIIGGILIVSGLNIIK